MENWKDNIMNSLEGMGRAQPPKDAFSKIQKTIAKQEHSQNVTERLQRLAIAAAIVLTISSNIYFISNYYDSEPAEHTELYQQVITSFNIYSQ